MRRGRGRRRWWFKVKGLRKIGMITPYSKNACQGHITSK
jgi:hypothetical protein